MFRNALMVMSLLVLTACGGKPIYNVSGTTVPSGLTTKQIESGIVTSLIAKGWKVKEQKEGRVVGELMLRAHRAVINIDYTASNFSINYVASENLKYNAEKNTIHRNYNNWIIGLERVIQSNLYKEKSK